MSDLASTVDGWFATLRHQAGREIIDLTYCHWDLDGRWHATPYACSIPLVELIAELEAAVGAERLYAGDPAARFLELTAELTP
jgi:hypothetical protein